MRNSRYYISVAIALIMLVTCVSCRQELCYDHYPTMNVRLSWELEWERDYGMGYRNNWDPTYHRYGYDELRPTIPEWVRMVRYFDDGRQTEHFLYPEGTSLEVNKDDEGSILLYNGDTEFIILSDVASMRDVIATATSRSRAGSNLQDMKDLYQASRTTNSPDVIYSAFIPYIAGVQNHEVRELPVKMQPLVYTYLITFEFEHGLEYVALARGALGGMAEGVYLRTGVTTDDTAIILFDCDIHSDACRSRVRSFGIPGFPDSYFGKQASGINRPYTLNLELLLKNGKTLSFNYDITDQMENQPRGGVIRIGGVRVEDSEKPPPSSSGLDVDLSSWDDNVEEIDIPIDITD